MRLKFLFIFLILSATCSEALAFSTPKGNGIIIDSAATDYFRGTSTATPRLYNLKDDLVSNNVDTSNLYVFPDFIYFGSIDNASQTPIDCAGLIAGNTSAFVGYYSLPQGYHPKGENPAVPLYLGNCVDGATLTAYYKSFAQYVVPMATYGGTFAGSLSNATVAQAQTAAQALAAVINGDPNTDGILFDLEPTFSSNDISEAFFGTLADLLAANNRSLFLFADYADLTAFIYSRGGVGPNRTNVVYLPPMYDWEGQQPTTIENHVAKMPEFISNYFSSSSAPPVMFTTAASSSVYMWDNFAVYNATADYKNPTLLTQSSNCAPPSPGSSEYLTISDLLCNDPKQTYCASGSNNTSGAINSFYNQQNCVQFINPVTMSQYLTSSLCMITNMTPMDHQRYIGVALYSWKIKEFNEFSCASNTIKPCLTFNNSYFTPEVWKTYNMWAAGSNTVCPYMGAS